MTYKSWLCDWLENYVKPSGKTRTYERYSGICALHIIPSLGEYELADISVIDLQKFVTELLTSGNHKTGKQKGDRSYVLPPFIIVFRLFQFNSQTEIISCKK